MIESRKHRQAIPSSSAFLPGGRRISKKGTMLPGRNRLGLDRRPGILLLLPSLLLVVVISLAASLPLHASASSIVSNPSFISKRTTTRRGPSFLQVNNRFSTTTDRSNHEEEEHDDDEDGSQTNNNQLNDLMVKRRINQKAISCRGGSRRLPNKNNRNKKKSIWYYLKISFAGGIAGAVGSTALYPMDAAKTLRQSNPSEYSSVFVALQNLICTRSATEGTTAWHIQRVYRGVVPAALGAIPSSCLYFGAYESMKAVMKHKWPLEGEETKTLPPGVHTSRDVKIRKNNFRNRLFVHGLAAMSGNVLSSAIFVPKELIKQQLQYNQQLSGNVWNVVVDILKNKGLGGLYVGYKATLMRNIPSAILRFSLYEEFRYRWTSGSNNNNQQQGGGGGDPRFFLAGAAAGILASGIMTPVDVLKTRLATGTCSVAASTNIQNCFWGIVAEEGIVGLYSGAGSRMIFSGAFSAIGFGTFEWAKGILGVQTTTTTTSSTAPNSSSNKKSISANTKKSNNNKQIVSSSCRTKTKAATAVGKTMNKPMKERLKLKERATRLLSTRKLIAAT